MKKCILHILIFLGFLLITSCVLPVPHRRVHVDGVDARIVSESDGRPVSGATISTSNGDMIITTADVDGRFRIKPQYGWHGAYLFGPISYSLWPHFDLSKPRPPFRVSATGFVTKTVHSSDPIEGENSKESSLIRLQPR